MGLAYWLIPHTHWDREWYLTFQDFRWKLVRSIDEILATLPADPGFSHFMLDGQTVVVEDYLELRPTRRQEIADLVRAGRIAVGPWYVQPDDVLVSAEALIRNLERGIRIATELGGCMRVGYLPDSFGHCDRLPSVLKGFGIDTAALMRGAGPELDKVFFHWAARDGARVLVAYLIDSYGNGADLATEPAGFRDGLAALEERQKGARYEGVPLLVMNGIDHRSIVAGVPRAIQESGLRDAIRIGSLEGYLETGRSLAGVPQWSGELRSPWRFPIITGCTSMRHWIKREDQAISALLEREAEPLAALAARLGAPYPSEAIDTAWKHLLQNQAHDSICGCSIDEVHEDMRYRYAQARGLAANVASDAAAWLASRADTSFAGTGEAVAVALNPGPARRGALLSFSAPAVPPNPELVDREGRVHPGQLLSEEGGSAIFFDERFSPRQLKLAMGMVKDGTFLEFSVQKASASWESPTVLRVELELGSKGFSAFDWNAWTRSTVPLLETPGLTQVHAVGLRSGAKRILFAADLPGFAVKGFHLRAGPTEKRAPGELRVSRRVLQSARYHVRVRGDGSLDVVDAKLGVTHRGVNQIVDGGDRGDEYTYDPPTSDRIVGGPAAALAATVSAPWRRRVRVDVLESGPVRGTLRIRSIYRLPAAVRRDRQGREKRTVSVEVVRFVSLTAGGDRIEFRTEIDNQARDHRMRVHLPLGGHTDASVAGGTFGSVRRPPRPVPASQGAERPVSPELGLEQEAATHPFTGFVACGVRPPSGGPAITLAVLSRGLREYEVVPGADQDQVAVTLFRSVGWLSRGDLAMRRGNAGPDAETPGAQEIGRQVFEYALVPYDGLPAEDLLGREWEDYRTSARVILRGAGKGDLADGESLLTVQDDGLIFSSLRWTPGGALCLRMYDASGTSRTVTMQLSRPVAWARKTRLDGAVLSELAVSGSGTGAAVPVAVQPWEIVTLELG